MITYLITYLALTGHWTGAFILASVFVLANALLQSTDEKAIRVFGPKFTLNFAIFWFLFEYSVTVYYLGWLGDFISK